jgi:hypothetical protein
VQYKLFTARLLRMNPKFRIVPNGGMAWGLFLKQPRHPDANEHGLVHLLSIPSPRFYSDSLPAKTIYNEKGNILVRGWMIVLRLLVGQRHLKARQVKALFGTAWETA